MGPSGTVNPRTPAALGVAVAPGEDAVYATVSLPAITLSVGRCRDPAINLPRVLGYTIAHEIGHVLLGANSHTATGLMQPVWNAQALAAMAKGWLRFTPRQARQVRAAVARRLSRAVPP